MVEFKSGYYVEHPIKNGWFLRNIKTTRRDIVSLRWSKRLESCPCWQNADEIEAILHLFSIISRELLIVDLTKEHGYHEYFRSK